MSCADCLSGAVHSGTPAGTVVTLHGRRTYVAEPASGAPPKGIVVIIPDAFGWEFVNIRLMADNYAWKSEYRVYLPDLMNSPGIPLWVIDTMPKLMKSKTWTDTLLKPYHFSCAGLVFLKFLIPNRPSKAYPVVADWFDALRRNEAAHLPVGTSGFCWGGKFVVLLAGATRKADGKPLIDAGFTAHPSMLSVPGDIEAIKLPVSFAIGSEDSHLPPKTVDKMRRIVVDEERKGEVKIYEGFGHGFGCRVDPVDQDPRAADKAEDQAVAWFKKNFEGVEY